MITSACQQVTGQVGNGAAAALRGVDCLVGETSASAFGRLFAPGGAMGTVLTIALTIYVALFAFGLLTGRGGLGMRTMTPKFITLGMVLTFATSWAAYQSVVWNLAVAGPDWLAGVITGTQGSATAVFAEKIDVVFLAIQEAAGTTGDMKSAFSPTGMMWLGAMLFMLGTLGLLVTAKIALGLLVAMGPIFVVMALFGGTRGLFAGWLKGLTMCALAPLFAVLGGGIMLELAVPVLAALTANPGTIDPQAGMAFFMIGAVHVALMVLVMRVAGTMVAGWTVFGLAPAAERSAAPTPAGAPAASPYAAQAATAATAASAAARRIDMPGMTVAAPANDAAAGRGNRTTIVHSNGPRDSGESSSATGPSRTHGIGSRFRASAPKPLSRSLEKHK